MTLVWKRILYWVSIVVILLPVLYIDMQFLALEYIYRYHKGINDFDTMMIVSLVVLLSLQLVATLFFIYTSIQKRFRKAFLWLMVFAFSGLASLVAMMIFWKIIFNL